MSVYQYSSRQPHFVNFLDDAKEQFEHYFEYYGYQIVFNDPMSLQTFLLRCNEAAQDFHGAVDIDYNYYYCPDQCIWVINIVVHITTNQTSKVLYLNLVLV